MMQDQNLITHFSI